MDEDKNNNNNNTLQQSSIDICERFWEWRLKSFPEFATAVGDHQYDDALIDLTLTGIKQRHDEAKKMLQEVEGLLKKMEEHGQPCENLKVLSFELSTYIKGCNHQTFFCPINICEGLQYDFKQLIDLMPRNDENDYSNILSRMSHLGNQVEQVIALMREGINNGNTLHAHSICPVVDQLTLFDTTVKESPFFEVFLEKPSNITCEKWNLIIGNGHDIIKDVLNPSFKKLIHFLESEYFRNTRKQIGISSTPNGKSVYSSYLHYHTSTNLSPTQIHKIGLKEVSRIQKRINELLKEIGFNGTHREFMNMMQMNNTKPSNESDVVNSYSELYDKISDTLPTLFNTLPRHKCEIKTFKNKNKSGGFYRQGNENRPGVFWINSVKVKSLTFRSLALALHEMIPGHHLQTEVELRKSCLPRFRRFRESGNYNTIPGRFPLYTALMEGWALYTESLGEELGLFNNPYELFGRLSSEIFRAARLVVDTGIHAFGWPRERAIDYMSRVVGLEPASVTSEVNRYITWPGQACAYKIGEIKLNEFRDMTRDALGKTFDIKEFHDVILHSGGVPFEMLEQNIKLYIERKLDKTTVEDAQLLF